MSDFRNDEYYENLDKRTKEYKNWLAIKQSQLDKQVKGAGDIVEKITEATGIKKVVKTSGCATCSQSGFKKAINKLHRYFDAAESLLDK